MKRFFTLAFLSTFCLLPFTLKAVINFPGSGGGGGGGTIINSNFFTLAATNVIDTNDIVFNTIYTNTSGSNLLVVCNLSLQSNGVVYAYINYGSGAAFQQKGIYSATTTLVTGTTTPIVSLGILPGCSYYLTNGIFGQANSVLGGTTQRIYSGLGAPNSGSFTNATYVNIAVTNLNPTPRFLSPQSAAMVQDIIAANISNNVPTSILFLGDSEANSGIAQASMFDDNVGLPSLLFNQFGYSGGGPDFNVDTGLNPSILNRVGSFTNWFGNFVTPVFLSDGTNALRSKFSSTVMRTNSPTQLGVDYIANSAGGNISILWTNELGTNAVLAASGNASTPTYKRLLFNNFGSATNNQIFFTSTSQTNILLGFVFINTNIPGVQCWSAAQGGISLSNMFTAGATSLQAFGTIINPDIIFYTGKDNEGGSMGAVPYVLSTYSSNLLNVLSNVSVSKTKVVYVTTPQQNGNFDNITQNNFARLIAFTNNWLWCDLGEYYPNWDVNNNGSMMLDGSHPNTLGATVFGQTLAALSGVKANNGSNYVYYGTFHGVADNFAPSVTFQPTFTIGAIFEYTPQAGTYGAFNVGYNFPGVGCIYEFVGNGVRIQGATSTEAVSMINSAGNLMAVFTTNLITLDSVVTNAAGVQGYSAGSAAAAGLVGEVISSKVAVASAVALTTAVPTNVTTLNLTKGDWDVSGSVTYTNSATTLPAGFDEVSSINTTANTIAFDGTEVYCGNPQTTVSDLDSGTLPIKQINVSSTTTVALVGQATFSAGGVKVFGSIVARRIR